MKSTIKRMEIARTGQFGLDGTELTLQDLRESVETFEKAAPVTIGHQMAKMDWFPQFGQVLTVELVTSPPVNGMESGTIIADVEFNELAAEAFEQGLYTGWSISIPRRAADGKRYIHHLALLGAVPPKIRDLKILQEMRRPVSADFADISASDTFCYTFSDQAKNEEGKVTDEEAKSLKEENKGLKEKIKNLEEKNGKEFADVSERLTMAESEIKRDKIGALEKAAEGKVPAASMGAIKELGDALFAETHDFADASGTKQRRRAIDVLIDVFQSIPIPNFAKEMEFADPAGDPKGRYGGVNRSDLARKM
jgi:hypothetical protein